MSKQPFLLCILDGVGLNKDAQGNAVQAAKTPFIDKLFREQPHDSLRTDGEYVGLPNGQMGNSEVGHITIGSGRVIKQPLERISDDLASGVFEDIEAFQKFKENAKSSRAVHLVGLLSDGGVHAHGDHALGLCKLFNGIGKTVFVHAITDGRDADPHAGKDYLQTFSDALVPLDNVHLASVIGRHYAMDRDQRWERVAQAWELYTQYKGETFSDIPSLFDSAYGNGTSDEYIPPSLLNIADGLDPVIQSDDSVFLFNFRADRMREITGLFLGNDIEGFDYTTVELGNVTSMYSYDSKFYPKIDVIYPEKNLEGTLGEIVSKAGMTQLHIAETEKYPHVTFYLNGGREEPYEGEDRILVPSPRDVDTYDQKPEMSLPELTGKLVTAIKSGRYDFIALNIANGDMVGHSGDFDATVKAIEAVDTALEKILGTVEDMDGQALVIADHGNAEEMLINGKPSPTHSTNPVPCIYFGKQGRHVQSGGSLADVAPTIVKLMGLEASPEMTGKPLVEMD